MANPAAVDAIQSRNNTFVTIKLDGQRVGRIQSFRENQTNNVQVLAELGRDVMAEMLRGIKSYSFSIASFYCHTDAMDRIKNGAVFSLEVRDEAAVGGAEVLEYFARCMVQSLSRDYTVGQAAIGQNAEVVCIGEGIAIPTVSA